MAHNSHIARLQVCLTNALGLHLRAANRFVKLATTFQSEIQVHCKGIVANGKSILDLLGLAAECGTMLVLEAQGCDAEDAVAALANLISAQFHESQDQGVEAA
jgi:phosphocarrier protein